MLGLKVPRDDISEGLCDDLAAMIEDTIKILDRVGNGLRHGRHPNAQEADRLGRVLRGIATALGA